MGNSLSNEEKIKASKYQNSSFFKIMDNIAGDYILTMNFQSLTKMQDKENCENLVILTSDIIEKYFTDLEISYLSQRIQKGQQEGQQGQQGEKEGEKEGEGGEEVLKKDKLLFFSKSDIDRFSVNKPRKKRRMCIGISKFYVKIAHVFAAIIMTINPVYQYSENGKTVQKGWKEKASIPKNAPNRKLLKRGLCKNFIDSLQRGKENKTNDPNFDPDTIVAPKLCSSMKTLEDEPGISELKELYYDNYDYQTGQFVGMTPATQSQFTKDLKIFYEVFTGNKVDALPEGIQTFADIKLRDYQKECADGKKFKLPTVLKEKSDSTEVKETKELFVKYADNLKTMMRSANDTQDELLSVINQLFSFVTEKIDGRDVEIPRINPLLSEAMLDNIIIDARKIITRLYLNCETNFLEGVKIYQAIVEKKIKDTTERQLSVLEETRQELISDRPTTSINDSTQEQEQGREDMSEERQEHVEEVRPEYGDIIEERPEDVQEVAPEYDRKGGSKKTKKTKKRKNNKNKSKKYKNSKL